MERIHLKTNSKVEWWNSLRADRAVGRVILQALRKGTALLIESVFVWVSVCDLYMCFLLILMILK